MSECLQAVVAAALAVQASAAIVLNRHTESSTCLFIFYYLFILFFYFLLSQPHITIEPCVTFNPATLLLTSEDGNQNDCVAKTD